MKHLSHLTESILSKNMDSDLPENILGISYRFEIIKHTDYTDPRAAAVRRKFLDMAAIKKDCGSSQHALQKHLIDTLCSSKLPARLQTALENDPNTLGGPVFKRYLNSIQDRWNNLYLKSEYQDSKFNHIELSIYPDSRDRRQYYMHALLTNTTSAVWLAIIHITPFVNESILSKNMGDELTVPKIKDMYVVTIKPWVSKYESGLAANYTVKARSAEWLVEAIGEQIGNICITKKIRNPRKVLPELIYDSMSPLLDAYIKPEHRNGPQKVHIWLEIFIGAPGLVTTCINVNIGKTSHNIGDILVRYD